MFDVGETLVDESRLWASVADQCGVSTATVCGVLGGLIERGQLHSQLWDVLGVDRVPPHFIIERCDLYPDACECIDAARARNLTAGIAGNQPDGLHAALAAAGIQADFIGSSAAWGVSKPHPNFFTHVIEAAQLPAQAILYVGDRLDYDVLPAHRAGMRTAHLRRGPWGYLHAQRPERSIADIAIDSLADLTAALVAAR